ncbi:iron chelate uptake ABC transporter family permease subunit [Rhizobium sp. RU36D]|uniref:ABC transporter permease n=1 Tax=Rhizobium sp. RU36D TaxID=1907415 RepID=UPI0009D8619F|nr:iron chelate uptake ABC transporter family permease subunit [Rhizobium sp. RU36D]SMC95066.1 iron complex transport system permease protein [Rhizobium sp. RU36D]
MSVSVKPLRSVVPWIAGLGLAILFLLSLVTGVSDMPLSQVFSNPEALQLLLVSRLPRTLAAILVGAGLAITGQIMQTLARNGFVEPSTAGTAQSAELGILAVIMLWPAAGLLAKSIVATVAALLGTSLFLMTAHRLPPTQPYLVPLFGIVYGGVIGAAVTFIAWQADLMQYLSIWTSGDFSGVLRGRYELLWVGAAMLVIAFAIADRLTIMTLGQDTTTGLGIDYRRMMQLGLVVVATVSALSTVVVGMIPFVGLVVPNIVSRLMGQNLRTTLPLIGISGALLVLGCDILGRVIRYPYEIPVGTVMGCVSGIIFLWLIFRRPAHG